MSNKAQVESAIRSFISDGGLRAIKVFGEWGTGKTYLVEKLLEQQTTLDLLKPLKLTPAYVSLFGVESVKELRHRLALSVINEKTELLEPVKKIWKIIPKKASVHGASIDISHLGDVAADYARDNALQNLLVCIDDLERATDALSMKDVMGFIADLTEQRGCKCLLIFNRAKLEKKRLQELEEYDEKAFDLSIEYRPTPADNLLFGISDSEDRKHARQVFAVFQNANIRVMKRLSWVIKEIRSCKNPEIAEVWPLVVGHAAILTILKHCYSNEIPDLEKAMKGSAIIAQLLDRKGYPKLPVPLKGYIDELGYQEAPFDKHLIGLLETGALQKGGFEKAVSEAVKEQRDQALKVKLHGFWDELRGGLVKDPNDFTARLRAFLGSNTEQINNGEFAQLADVLLAIDDSKESLEIVRAKLGPVFKHVSPDFRVKNLERFPGLRSAKVMDSIPFEPKVDAPDLAAAVKSVAGGDSSWDPAAFTELAQFSDEALRAYFLKESSDNGIFQLKHLLDRIPNSDPEQAKATRARLERIYFEIADKNPVHRYQIDCFVRPVPKK